MNRPTFQPPLGRSALVALYRAIGSYFAAQKVDAKVYLGLKARDNWDTSRVVVIDGEFSGETSPKALPAGQLYAPTQKQSFNPRELAAWPRPVTLSIRGVDKTALDDEGAQTEAQEALVEATLRAVINAMDPVSGTAVGQANIAEWGPMLWVVPPVQQAYGKELLLQLTLRCVFLDLAQETATPTPALAKGPLLSTPVSGVNAAIVSVTGTQATVDGLGFVSLAWAALSLELSGAATPGNNGTFPIAQLLWPRSVVIENAAAVAGDANNGAIAWRLSGG